MLDKLKGIIPKGLKKQAKLIFHKGDRYICSFCGYSSKDLAPIGIDLPVLKDRQVIGGGKRFGGRYNCGSIDRERLIYAYLNEKENIFKSGKVKSILHIAPEIHLSKKILGFDFDLYICGDLFTDGYSYPKHVQNINILDIPFENDSFDLIICNHVLEHIIPDGEAMKELYRVLKKGGQAILQVPISKNSETTFEDFKITDPKEREIVFGQFDHVRIYGQDYPKRLEENGFKVWRVNISKEFLQFGLDPDEDIFIGKK